MKPIKITDMQAGLISERLFFLTLGGADEFLSDSGYSTDDVQTMYDACPKRQGLWFIADNKELAFFRDEVDNLAELAYQPDVMHQDGEYRSLSNLLRKLET